MFDLDEKGMDREERRDDADPGAESGVMSWACADRLVAKLLLPCELTVDTWMLGVWERWLGVVDMVMECS